MDGGKESKGGLIHKVRNQALLGKGCFKSKKVIQTYLLQLAVSAPSQQVVELTLQDRAHLKHTSRFFSLFEFLYSIARHSNDIINFDDIIELVPGNLSLIIELD